MRCCRKFVLLSLLCLSCALYVQAQPSSVPTTPAFSGRVPDVRQINTTSLLRQMAQGSSNSDLVLVAAHRGYWINYPENSDPAIRAAFDNGIEVVEIDVRSTSDGVVVVSHDGDLDKETTGSGLIESTPWAQMNTLPLRDRRGNPQNLNLLSFAQALQILGSYQQTSGTLRGPVIIVDIKGNPNDSWATYQRGKAVLQATLPSAAWPAVVFKMKMITVPMDGISAEYNAHSSWGHILTTINPEDATNAAWSPSSTNFQTLLTFSQADHNFFLQQFEMNINTVGDGATKYISGQGGPLTSFATYHEPKFYPEGVSTIFGGAGDSRVFTPNPPPPFQHDRQTFCCYKSFLSDPPKPELLDLRGLLDFSLYYNQTATPGVSLITTDNLSETLNLLVAAGKRNVSEITN
jgi:Glycerophosphoryl diester phosphodiesterase family